MCPVDVGVGKTRPGDANRSSTARGSDGVMGSSTTNAQGGALLPKVPSNPGEEFDAAAETEEAHGL